MQTQSKGPMKSATSTCTAKAVMVRAKPTTTHTAGIDTSPWLGSPCRKCHELSAISGQKWIRFEEVWMANVSSRAITVVGKINTTLILLPLRYDMHLVSKANM